MYDTHTFEELITEFVTRNILTQSEVDALEDCINQVADDHTHETAVEALAKLLTQLTNTQ